MEEINQKLDRILIELEYLREQILLGRNDTQNFAKALDKEIKSKIYDASDDIIKEIKKSNNR